MNEDFVSLFLVHVSAERGLSPNTIAAYQSDIASLTEFLRLRGTSLANAQSSDCEAWISSLRRKGLASASISRKTSVVRNLARYCFQNGLLELDLSSTLDEPPRQALRLPRTLTAPEMTALLAPTDNTATESLRDIAMLELMYGSGLRVSELVNLTIAQLDLISQTVCPMGKGNKERLVPVSNVAASLLERYLAVRRVDAGSCGIRPSEWLFPTKFGVPMTRQHFWHLIKERAVAVGITRKVTPHMLRHSFATHLLARGADVRVIQEMLGHASVATTQRYTNVDIERMRASYVKAHPRSV